MNNHPLSAHSFFSLEGSGLEELFQHKEWVWQALIDLESFLDKQIQKAPRSSFPSHAYIVNPEKVRIGSGTVIEPGAYIEGPCYIGKDCIIRHGAYIRKGSWIGDRCVVGHATEIKHSILFPRSAAPHFNYVGDSILGPGANLGAGVKCANVRLDKKTIKVRVEGKRYDTGMIKLGAIIGENVRLGCNAVTNPGTFLGRDSGCYPCIHIGGYVPSNTILKNNRIL